MDPTTAANQPEASTASATTPKKTVRFTNLAPVDHQQIPKTDIHTKKRKGSTEPELRAPTPELVDYLRKHLGGGEGSEDLPTVEALGADSTLIPELLDYKTPESKRPKMTEVRARAARHKGQLNFGPELASLLYAFGDDANPLPETVRVLDVMVTDFIIEVCHNAANVAHISGRQKVKVDDFMFAIRKNDLFVGRVRELLSLEKELKEARKQFDTGEGKVGLERGGRKKKEKEAEVAEEEE